MKLETKRRLSMLLLAVAVVFWLLRQLAVVYIPGVSALALAGAMLLLASGMDRSRSGQKAAVTLIFAFGLLNILRLVRRQDSGAEVIHSHLGGNGCGGAVAVAGKHDGTGDPQGAEGGQDFLRLLPQRVGDAYHSGKLSPHRQIATG